MAQESPAECGSAAVDVSGQPSDRGPTGENDQRMLKEEYLHTLRKLSDKYKGRCFERSGLISLMDLSKVRKRLAEKDLKIYIAPEVVSALGASALYVKECAGGTGIILGDIPSSTDPKDLYHEAMHAIFDKNQSDLALLGYQSSTNDEESLPWFMEHLVNILDILEDIESEMGNIDSEEPPDADKINRMLDVFLSSIEDTKKNPTEGRPVTREALDFVTSVTGLYVAPPDAFRRAYLENGLCASGR